MSKRRNHLLIPDLQVKPGVRTVHLDWIGRFIKAKRPDVIIQIGDWADMASLSSYDFGKRAAEGKRLDKDFAAFTESVQRLEQHYAKIRNYKPRKIFCEGNHEQRIRRYENDYPHLAGSLPRPMDFLAERGWECHPFLRVAWVDKIAYSHFFAKTSSGTTSFGSSRNGASSAKSQLKNNMVSCVAGHRQGFDVAYYDALDGRKFSVIAGSCYLHGEGYRGPQGQDEWRGIVHIHGVSSKAPTVEPVSLDFLKERYSK